MAINHTNNELTNDKDAKLRPETIKLISRSLTGNAHIILKELYRRPYIRQKDLSSAVLISPSNLSNQLNRICSIFPLLIDSEQRGRDKFFFLTPDGTAYIRQELQKSADRVMPFPLLNQETSVKPQYNGVEIPKQVYDKALNDSDSLRDYINLSPLFDLEKAQFFDMNKVIDDVFLKLFPSAFPSKQPEKKPYTAFLTDAQYYAFFFTVSQLTLYYINNDFDKDLFLKYMQTSFDLDSQEMPAVLFSLAEKMDRLQTVKNSGRLL